MSGGESSATVVARVTQWRKDNPDRARAINRKAQRRYRVKNRDKELAHGAVRRALKRGDLVRHNVCEHCFAEVFTEASHSDYERKLDVEWLCRKCHMEKDGLGVGGGAYS